MNINDLTIGEAKELARLFSGNSSDNSGSLNSMIGKKCIIRTYSAGVHYGELVEKSGKEVILKNARRLWYWKTKGGISLSEVANSGVHKDSKICESVDSIWLDAIETIPCSQDAIKSIESQNVYKA